MQLILASVISILFLAKCNSTQEKKHINPPVPGMEEPFKSFFIRAGEKDTFELASGTQLAVPVNCFVNKEGDLIKGEVEIMYREYHDAVDIMLSGIPMTYNSIGTEYAFQTAGMFEIRAKQKDKPVSIKKGKSIKIRMASSSSDPEHNLFFFNEKEGEWSFVDYSPPEANAKLDKIKDSIKIAQPPFKVPFANDYFVFNYESVYDVVFANNPQKHRKYRSNNKKIYTAQKYGLKIPEIECCCDYARYKGNRYPAYLLAWKNVGKPFPSWVKNCYAGVEPVSHKRYALRIINRENSNIHFETIIEPVIPLKYLFKFSPEHWKKEYQAAMAEINRMEENLKYQAEAFREFDVTRTGLFNYDKLLKREGSFTTNISYTLDQQSSNSFHELKRVFCIPSDNRTVIKVPKGQKWQKTWINPADKEYRIVAILPGKKIAVFSPGEYKDLPFEQLAADTSVYEIELKTKPKPFESAKELKKQLGLY